MRYLSCMTECPLCQAPGGEPVWEDHLCRVVRVGGTEGESFAGYCRVVWHSHVAEMTDLDAGNRRHLMNVVFAVEMALRSLLAPDKINLATLGNLVPHLHWHIIPRWHDDSHYPAAIWAVPPAASASTTLRRRPAPDDRQLRAAIVGALAEDAGGA
jgi:diadenosine tetraphosphate (Ap4A) HIT family hydrolase